MKIAIIANGMNPETPQERAALAMCDGCVCCDRLPPEGAPRLLQIVGDLDTLKAEVAPELLTALPEDQETNDLTKAVMWVQQHVPEATLAFFGVTGKREDHTLANLSLIAGYGLPAEVFTASGQMVLLPAGTHRVPTVPQGAVSLLSFVPQRVTAEGVRWPVQNLLLETLWRATLNQATGSEVTVTCEAPCFVYQPWREV